MSTRGTIYSGTSVDFPECSVEFHSASIGDGAAASGDKMDSNNNHDTTSHANFTPSPSAVPLVADQWFETPENPINIQQRPSCAVDYWFEELVLSLGPTPLENPSNPTRFLAQSALGDSVNDVSLLLVVYSTRLPYLRII